MSKSRVFSCAFREHENLDSHINLLGSPHHEAREHQFHRALFSSWLIILLCILFCNLSMKKIIHAHHTCIYEWAVSRILKSRSPNLPRPYIIKIGTLIFIISGMEIWRRNEMKNGLALHFQFIHQSKSCLFKRRALFVLEPRCWARDNKFSSRPPHYKGHRVKNSSLKMFMYINTRADKH